MQQHIICVLGILFIIGVFVFLAIVVEPFLIENYDPPDLSNTTLETEEWIANFQVWALVCVTTAGVSCFLWYGLGQRVFKTETHKTYGKRGWWLSLFILPAVAISVSIFFIEKADSSLWLAYLCFILNGLGLYYFATVFFSPTSVKYTPIGSIGIRRFW